MNSHPQYSRTISTRFSCVARKAVRALALSLCLAAAGALPVQAASVTLGEATTAPGQGPVGLPVALTVTSGEQVTAMLVDIKFDPAVAAFDSFTVEPAVAALGKEAQARLVSPGLARVALYGYDQQTLSGGAIGRCLLRALSTAPQGGSLVELQDGAATNPAGQDLSLNVTAGRLWVEAPTLPTLSILSPADEAVVIGTSITVQPAVTGIQVGTGAGKAHLHYRINDGPVIEDFDLNGHTFTNVLPARHKLGIMLAQNADHARVPGSEYQVIYVNVESEAPVPVPAPTVQLVTPVSGSTLTGTDVAVNFTVQNTAIASGGTHLALTLDAGAPQQLTSLNPVTLTNVAAGPHTLTLRLVDAANAPLPNPEATATVTFVTELPAPAAPALTVLSPTAEAVITGTSVTATVGVTGIQVGSGAGKAHLHYRMNDGTVVEDFDLSGHTFTNVAPGYHKLGIMLADNATHTRIAGTEYQTVYVTVEAPTTPPAPEPTGATLKLLSPQPNSTIAGSKVTVTVEVKGVKVQTGSGHTHLHIKLDDGQVWHVYNTKPFVLTGVKPGTHTVGVMLADNDTHTRISGTEYLKAIVTVVP